jgi:hypothetical protein
MVRKLACIFTIILAPIVCTAESKSLPAGGGEPGKAYLDCTKAIAKQDKNGIITLCFSKDDAWIKKANLDYFTPETFAVEVRQLKPAFRLTDVKITGGKIDGQTADLLVEGTILIQRLEPTGEIVEVDRLPAKGSVQMTLINGKWFYSSENLEQVYN